MRSELIGEIADKFRALGIPPEFGPENSRVLVGLWRALAKGEPVTPAAVDALIARTGANAEVAQDFLANTTERNDAGDIVGAVGLSLNDHPHGFSVNGSRHSTWCAWDALFLPPLIGETAEIESKDPQSGETVRITASPDRIESVSPSGSVVTVLVPGPDVVKTDSVEDVWTTFCHHIFFFDSRDSAEAWAVGRPDIQILTVEEGYELGKLSFGELLTYAPEPVA